MLRFECPFRWFPKGGRMNILAPLDRGEVSAVVEGGQLCLRYRLSFRRLVILGTLLVLCVFGPPLTISAIVTRSPENLGILPLAWLWYCGGNYLLSSLRFPSFLRRAARAAEEQGAIGDRRRAA